MAEKEIQKYSAEYLAEQKKKEEADRLTNEAYYKRADHRTERTREIEKEENLEYPEKLFYEFFPTCNGNIKVQMSGVFGRHFIVKENGPQPSAAHIVYCGRIIRTGTNTEIKFSRLTKTP